MFSVTEEDFVMLYSKKIGEDEPVCEEPDNPMEQVADQSKEEVIEDDGSPRIENVRHLVKVC